METLDAVSCEILEELSFFIPRQKCLWEGCRTPWPNNSQMCLWESHGTDSQPLNSDALWEDERQGTQIKMGLLRTAYKEKSFPMWTKRQWKSQWNSLPRQPLSPPQWRCFKTQMGAFWASWLDFTILTLSRSDYNILKCPQAWIIIWSYDFIFQGPGSQKAY